MQSYPRFLKLATSVSLFTGIRLAEKFLIVLAQEMGITKAGKNREKWIELVAKASVACGYKLKCDPIRDQASGAMRAGSGSSQHILPNMKLEAMIKLIYYFPYEDACETIKDVKISKASAKKTSKAGAKAASKASEAGVNDAGISSKAGVRWQEFQVLGHFFGLSMEAIMRNDRRPQTKQVCYSLLTQTTPFCV